MPSPQEELCRLLGSPEPTQTMEGSEGAMAMSPMVETDSLSKTGSQVVPLLVVFQTPPEATPTKTMLGLDSTTAKSSMRPPMTAGPISRNSRALNFSMGEAGAGADSADVAFWSFPLSLDFGFCASERLMVPSRIRQEVRAVRIQALDIVPPRKSFCRVNRRAAHHNACT